ncbi:MAG: HAD family hydrolase [Xanthobacteraceae bacterium]|nr:HAD family hydrolase [Xanthobacteraceae bacterium]
MNGVAGRPALFLDRDGVINVDRGYVHRVDQFEFLPGIFELARFAAERAWPIVVVTNQAGIGRGLYGEADYQTVNQWMCDCFRGEQAPIARVYHCPFHAELGVGEYRVDHPWRKPKPGMILQASADLGLDLSRSCLIGDKVTDIEAAAAAGVPERILLDPEGLGSGPEVPPHRLARDLAQALAWLREFARSAGERPATR